MDPRHARRIKLIQNLFAASFPGLKDNLPYPDLHTTEKVIEMLPQIDALITSKAPKFPIANMSRIDVSILRLAVYELEYDSSMPTKVVINEAVELAKEFGGDKSFSFVNAVLGSIVNQNE